MNFNKSKLILLLLSSVILFSSLAKAGRVFVNTPMDPEESASYREKGGIIHLESIDHVLEKYVPLGIIKEIGPARNPVVPCTRGVYVEPCGRAVGPKFFNGTYHASVKNGFHTKSAALVMKNVPLFGEDVLESVEALKNDLVPILIDLSADSQFDITGETDPRSVEGYELFTNRREHILATGLFEILSRFTTRDGLVGTVYRRKCLAE